MEEIHEGVCGPHMNETVLAKKIARQGYFWLIMETDCVKFVKKCQIIKLIAMLASYLL